MNTLDYVTKKFGISNRKKALVHLENFGRDDLADMFRELGFKVGAEIGVQKGRYSLILCQKIPELKLYSIDPWIEHNEYVKCESQEKLDSFYSTAKDVLSPYNCELIKKKSMDAVNDFEDESLDFIYIDGNHEFFSETNDIHFWSKKIKKGGIISGHDYRKYLSASISHSYEVVNGYTSAYRINPWFVIGKNTEPIRSWFWVKK